MTDLQNKPSPAASVVVVIAFFNGADTIERALRSVFTQSVPACEVVVVNDGSRPEELAALTVLADRYPITIVTQSNAGQGAARNAGVAASSAAYICFLDQDDFYLPRHIEDLAGAIPPEDPLLGFVYADLYEADAAGRIVLQGMLHGQAGQHPKRSVVDMLRHDMFVLPSAAIISRRAFEAIGGFDTQFRGYEDDDLFLRIFRAGFSNHFLDKCVTVWCIHGASTSYGLTMIRSRYRYFRKMVEMFPDEPLRSRYYLRDCLIPRFGGPFIEQCTMQALKGTHETRTEMNRMLSGYIDLLAASPRIDRLYVLRLRLIGWILRSGFRPVLRLAASALKLPGLKLLRKLYR